MRLVVVTTCTDRKRSPSHPPLVASDLPQGTQEHVASEWRIRRLSAPVAGAAHSIYCGRSFREAELAGLAARADLYIVSGGLGLVAANDEIPSYSLTLVRGSTDYIG